MRCLHLAVLLTLFFSCTYSCSNEAIGLVGAAQLAKLQGNAAGARQSLEDAIATDETCGLAMARLARLLGTEDAGRAKALLRRALGDSRLSSTEAEQTRKLLMRLGGEAISDWYSLSMGEAHQLQTSLLKLWACDVTVQPNSQDESAYLAPSISTSLVHVGPFVSSRWGLGHAGAWTSVSLLDCDEDGDAGDGGTLSLTDPRSAAFPLWSSLSLDDTTMPYRITLRRNMTVSFPSYVSFYMTVANSVRVLVHTHNRSTPSADEQVRRTRHWHTSIMRVPFSNIDASSLCSTLERLAKTLPTVHKSNKRGGVQSRADLFHSGHNLPHAMYQLRNYISQAVFNYTVALLGVQLDSRGGTLEVDIVHAWINVSPVGAFNAPHTHPDTHISGVYYASAGEMSPLCFMDARPTGLRECISPEQGSVFIFPSWLEHYVEPHLDPTTPRVVVAFNVRVHWLCVEEEQPNGSKNGDDAIGLEGRVRLKLL